ncbi:uncharacterized protein LOC114966354 isoform X2 [Acropora millepora]|uniref:uncharacterized protein LOC114966354 isoform X2 n=1 Tax=Acropora millepora TaxID=45264 RepID=UPI001CF4CED5|nr:uncharacterized protein LOC114966354 isoform X2 [Acropora millepora]
MAVSNVVVQMVRVLAIIHIVVGALLIAFSIIYAVVGYILSFAVPAVFMGVWMCIAGGLGIPASSPQRTSNRNCFAGIFMGFSITSAVFGGLIIIGYIVIVSGDVEEGLAAVILTLGIIEFGAGIWVSICLCLMKPCCNDSQQTVAFPGGIPGFALSQGGDGVPVPLQVPGVTVQTQSFNGNPQAGQRNFVDPVPFQAVGNQPHPVVASSPCFPPQHTEKSPKLGQYVPL